MQYTANTTCDRRVAFQRRLERAAEWSRRPMTGRAECAVATVGGTLLFSLLFAVYMLV